MLLKGIVDRIEVRNVRLVHVDLPRLEAKQLAVVEGLLSLALDLCLRLLLFMSLDCWRVGRLADSDYERYVVHLVVHPINERLVNHFQVRLNYVVIV